MKTSKLYIITTFLVLSLLIIISGYFYYKFAQKSYKKQISQELSSIADMKVHEIIHWRNERLADAELFHGNKAFSALIKRYFQNPDDSAASKEIKNWMGIIDHSGAFDGVFLEDLKFIKKIIISDGIERSKSYVSPHSMDSLMAGKIVFEDFYLNDVKKQIFLKILIPILDRNDNKTILGFVDIRMNPETYLYPTLQNWPIPNKTSETVILRREGNDIIILNRLKSKPDAPLKLRISMDSKTAVPGIKAAQGIEGVVDDIDYRGVHVIAALRTIHGSPWFMVARMDESEALSSLHETLRVLIFLICFIIVVLGLSVGFIWRQRKLRFYKEKFESSKLLQESNERYESLIKTSLDGFWVADTLGRILEVNDAYCSMTGYSKEKLLTMRIPDLEATESSDNTREHIEKIVAHGQDRFETKHRCADGKIIDVIISTVFISSQKILLVFINNITEQKLAETLLQKSIKDLADYKYALDETAIVAFTDSKGIIKYVNDNFCKISKYSRKELIGQDHRIISSGYHPKEFIRDLWVTITNGEIWNGELKNKAKDGSIYWVDTNIIPFLDEQGNPFQYLAFRIDITERKNAEQKLESTALKLKEAQATAHLGNWDVILATKISTWSDETFHILGLDRNEVIPSREMLYTCIHPEDMIFVHEKINEILTTKKACKFNYRIKRKDGKVIYAFSEVDFDFDNDGTPIRLFGTIQDITENKIAEENLKKSEEGIRLLLNSTAEAIYGIDTEGNCTFFNPSSLEMLGYESSDQLIGQNMHRLIHYAHIDGRPFSIDECTIYKTMRIGENGYNDKEVFWRKDGICFPVEYWSHPIFYDGKITGAVVSFLDITKRKKAEEELININKELESFSYSVSHDLRAPLRAINGYAKILEEDYYATCDEDGKKSLNAIKNNSKKMGELIDALLAFSRLGKKDLNVSEINMTALVNSVREEEMIGNSNEINFTLHELLPAIGDPQLIKQVWVNLFSNAVKYSKRKPKTIIEIGSFLKDGLVVYYVKDNGAGFDMQYYDKLFGVFQRLHSQEEFEGTGIGLAIVQKIIKKHTGTVWAESKINEGTCFYFSLPAIITLN